MSARANYRLSLGELSLVAAGALAGAVGHTFSFLAGPLTRGVRALAERHAPLPRYGKRPSLTLDVVGP